MGFNNAGAEALAARIADARPHLPRGFAIGVNIGRNRDGTEDDYPGAARAVAGLADYLAVNVSSPNTPGLRQLQDPLRLRAIVDAVADAARRTPLFVKLAPDLSDDELGAILDALDGSAAGGVIVSNTTITRPGLRSRRLAQESGGLSGRPSRRPPREPWPAWRAAGSRSSPPAGSCEEWTLGPSSTPGPTSSSCGPG
jgi:dihydroorotate dehydrogenase